MITNSQSMQMEAQQTLDELFAADQIPFALTARAVESLGMEEFIVRFHESRLRSVDVSCRQDQTFKQVFRTAILDRVARLEFPQNFARAPAPHHSSRAA
jgi:hypothetical protein